MIRKVRKFPYKGYPHYLSYELSGKIEDVIQRLDEIKKSVPEGVQIYLDYDTEYGSYGDSDRNVVFVYEDRLETDEECQAREKKEAEEQQERIAQKRIQLEKLKKELGEE